VSLALCRDEGEITCNHVRYALHCPASEFELNGCIEEYLHAMHVHGGQKEIAIVPIFIKTELEEVTLGLDRCTSMKISARHRWLQEGMYRSSLPVVHPFSPDNELESGFVTGGSMLLSTKQDFHAVKVGAVGGRNRLSDGKCG
jgi:hypothetical protein